MDVFKPLSIKDEKKDRIRLDIMPFAYNLFIIISFVFPFTRELLEYIAGFGILLGLEYLFQSKIIHKYCIWHQIPIYNIIMVSGFQTYNYIAQKMNVHFSSFQLATTTDKDYPILFYIFQFSVAMFVLSAIFFLRKRFKKNIKRCGE